MYTLYSALLAFLLVLTSPYWLLQMMRHGKYRAGLRQRFGAVPPALIASRGKNSGGKPTIWVHAVSVGEVVASSGVIAALRQKFQSHRILISTTTGTGQKLAGQRFGTENVFYFPLDFAFAIRPYLNALRPELVVVAETEFWPNFFWLAKRSGARIAVINCRISDRSLPGYKRFRFWLPRLLEKTLASADCFLAQTEEDRKRLIEIGASQSKITVAGNLKFDIAPPPEPEIVARLRESFSRSGAGPILVCGSTLEGEEGSLLSAFRNILANHPKAVIVLAPRHPERFSEVAALVEKLGFLMWRRSGWNGDGPDGEALAGGVFLVDTIGELAALYSLATVAFVGGSLVPRGGHNILEPALYGVPIVTGNHYENFRDIVNFFASHNAVRIVGLAELPLVFMELVDNHEERATLGKNALTALGAQRGATAKTVAALLQLMDVSSS
jgi:3-deoxy-D-manno-octulosonic-acid transferase